LPHIYTQTSILLHRHLLKKVYDMLATLPSTQSEKNRGTYERIDGLETGLHGLVHRLSGDDTRGLELNSLALVRANGAETINGVTKSIDNSAEHALTNGHVDDGTGSLDNITLLDLSVHQISTEGLTCRYQGRQYQRYQFPS